MRGARSAYNRREIPIVNDRPVVIGAGELLWDIYPDSRRPGGAPANVAFHAQQLGLNGAVFSRVGQDELGTELRAYLEQNGLCTDWLQSDPVHTTGRVLVDLSTPAHPSFTIEENAAWDYLELDENARKLAAQATAVCFGTLAQRCETSRAAIRGLLALAQSSCLIVYDINLRPPWYDRQCIEESLHAAHVVKLNDVELRVVAQLLEAGSDDPVEVARHIQTKYGVDLVCVTRGADGCLLVDLNGVAESKGIAIPDVDPVGAGDAFTAALIFGQLRKWSLPVKADFANQIAALVAAREGAMPKLAAEFAREMARFQ